MERSQVARKLIEVMPNYYGNRLRLRDYDKLIKLSQEIYMNNTTIYADSEEEIKYLSTNKFYEFLEQDDRTTSCEIHLKKGVQKYHSILQ